MPRARDGKLTLQRWRDFVQWLALQESFFIDEGRGPPLHIRQNTIDAFCKAYGISCWRVSNALKAWESDEPSTMH